jgi:mono/diheme cytochrome c family protein
VKTFRLPLTAGDPSSAVRVETRVLMHSGSGWDGYCYRWRDDQTDADLLPGSDTRSFTIADPAAPGGTRSQTWSFPSRGECMRCHTAAAGRVLGVNTRQINRLHDFGVIVDNQLRAWDHVDLFTSSLGLPAPYPAHADPADTSAAVSARARAYLDANCSMCHRPGGTSQSPMDLRTLVTTAQMNVVGAPPQFGDLGLTSPSIVAPGNRSNSVLWHRMRRLDTVRMPPLSTSVVDAIGEDLIGAWIDSGP